MIHLRPIAEPRCRSTRWPRWRQPVTTLNRNVIRNYQLKARLQAFFDANKSDLARFGSNPTVARLDMDKSSRDGDVIALLRNRDLIRQAVTRPDRVGLSHRPDADRLERRVAGKPSAPKGA